MKRICVFCGSNFGLDAAYREAAQSLGRTLVRRQIGLVYGGGSVGLMGTIADAVLQTGGEVIGVIPKALATRELLHTGLTDLRVVESMHERKALMSELADGFIAMPGGLGTLEELLEILTWAQLGIHQKPCGVLNVLGYYDPLVAFLDHSVRHGFVRSEHAGIVQVHEDAEELLEQMRTYVPPQVEKWICEQET